MQTGTRVCCSFVFWKRNLDVKRWGKNPGLLTWATGELKLSRWCPCFLVETQSDALSPGVERSGFARAVLC